MSRKSGKRSAGLLLYRKRAGALEVFLVHPGGPFWTKKDAGAWTIPKGEIGEDEDPLVAARREMAEETGFSPEGRFIELPPVRQKAGKLVLAWAIEGDCEELRRGKLGHEHGRAGTPDRRSARRPIGGGTQRNRSRAGDPVVPDPVR